MNAFIGGERMLCVHHVVQRLGVSERAVRNWARNGLLPSIRIGKLWLFRLSDVEPLAVALSQRRRCRKQKGGSL